MKTAKLFKNGQSQAVRLPKEFRFSGEEVFISRVGDVVMLVEKKKRWDSLRKALTLFSGDFMNHRSDLPQQKRKEL